MKTYLIKPIFLFTLALAAAAPAVRAANVKSTGPVSTVVGDDKIKPDEGTQGSGPRFNFWFYLRPGEGEGEQPGDPSKQRLPHEPFFIAYDRALLERQPVQSNHWWTSVGLQWYVPETDTGWAFAWEAGVIRSTGFISEPFSYQFIDFDGRNGSQQPPLPPPHGLRLWNQNAIAVSTNGKNLPTDPGFNPKFNIADRAFLAPEVQAVVTVGLENVHPLRNGDQPPREKPWTNVTVQNYSDWGVVLAYGNSINEMEITMANGSPFTWFERTKGSAKFKVWAGGAAAGGAAPDVWENQNGVLGMTVSSPFNAERGRGIVTSTAAYLIIADQGTWERQDASGNGKQSMFTNNAATRVVVLAMPHNIPLNDHNKLLMAAEALKPYACQKIVDTKIDYPPISGSEESADVGGREVKLGYSPTNNQVALQLRVKTAPFFSGGCVMAPEPIQLLFPHHLKSLPEEQKAKLDTQYTWNTIMGPVKLYRGSAFVQEIDAKGFLPFLPSEAVATSQKAVDDIYETMRNWFYLQELQPGGNISSFVRNIGTYDNVQSFSYLPPLSTLCDSLIIADQLAQSDLLTGDDKETNELNACLCKPKRQVAAEMRDYILQALKELVGQWADVYTAQLVQYNPDFKTIYGFMPGHGSCQNLNDHHFIFGYFLRAAAAIGRYDPAWLHAYMPFFNELRRDVANYHRGDKDYPFLRNFNPFYGHSWASGVFEAGANQESTSEAINFSAALTELGLLLGRDEWRDLGIYMYEQEILATEQYWFNQDADLTKPVPTATPDPNNIKYNGNWPEEFVTYEHGGKVWHTTLAGILYQQAVSRGVFFPADVDGTYSIQMIPLSANTLYLGRNQKWLKATWDQYLMDTEGKTAAQENIIAGWQARMPASGSGINGTGLDAALKRINREHVFQPQATNTMAKYWAYTNDQLGQVDTSIVADTPAYGVFENSAQGSRFVAYNPTDKKVKVSFKQRKTNSEVLTLEVGPHSIASANKARTLSTFTPATITKPKGRLYLGLAKGTQEEPLPLKGKLTADPGDWLPTEIGDNKFYAFPSNGDISRITPSLAIVPKTDQNCGTLDIPGETGSKECMDGPKTYAVWEGRFSGKLVGEQPLTQMAIYTDPALHPGWQQDPTIQTNATVRIEYYFDETKETPDRVEIYNRALFFGNSFVMQENKFTHYYFGCYSDKTNFGKCNGDASGLYGLGINGPGMVQLDNRFNPAAPFPPTVTRGKIRVLVFGAQGPKDLPAKVPVPVSVDTDPLLNRASWVQPPYDGT